MLGRVETVSAERVDVVTKTRSAGSCPLRSAAGAGAGAGIRSTPGDGTDTSVATHVRPTLEHRSQDDDEDRTHRI